MSTSITLYAASAGEAHERLNHLNRGQAVDDRREGVYHQEKLFAW